MSVVVHQVTEDAVRRSIATAQTHLEKAAEEIVWQIQNQAWCQLGYDSWDAMRDAEYGGAAIIVPRADQPQLMTRLRSEGMSQRSIGDTLGVNQATVSRNMQTHIEDAPATRTDSLGRERPTSYAPREPFAPPARTESGLLSLADAEKELEKEERERCERATKSVANALVALWADLDPDPQGLLDDWIPGFSSHDGRPGIPDLFATAGLRRVASLVDRLADLVEKNGGRL
jgi:predicted XRE-type DNA-binding protein